MGTLTFNNTSNQLPVRAWQNTMSFLSDEEQNTCAQVSKRLGVIAICDPSADLEAMNKNATKKRSVISKSLSIPTSSSGPTSRFLNYCKTNPLLQDTYSKIQEKRESDPNVDQTVQNVCRIESAYPDYIPLYHGGRLDALILKFLIRECLSTAYTPGIEELPCSNPMIFFPSLDDPSTIGKALSEFPPDFDDHMENIRKVLLSCNAMLFANLNKPGECTWNFYSQDLNVFQLNIQEFLKKICKNYQIKINQKLLDQLETLHQELRKLAITFAEQNLPPGSKTDSMCKGALFQILIKPEVLDKVAYAALPIGHIQKSNKPLSETCLSLREDPNGPPDQVRLLTQSLFMKENGIKVFTHCCGGFFNEEGLADTKPNHMTEDQWAIQKKCLIRKKEIFEKARGIFTQMILSSPKKPKKVDKPLSTAPKMLGPSKLKEKASMILPPGFSLQSFYNGKILEKVIQKDPEGQETVYIPIQFKPMAFDDFCVSPGPMDLSPGSSPADLSPLPGEKEDEEES